MQLRSASARIPSLPDITVRNEQEGVRWLQKTREIEAHLSISSIQAFIDGTVKTKHTYQRHEL